MARLSMNDGLTELGEDVLYKASGKYQRRHTDRDSNQRGRSTGSLTEYVAESKQKLELHWLYLSASTMFIRPAFQAGRALASSVVTMERTTASVTSSPVRMICPT